MKRRYVAGFYTDGSRVALVEKIKPDWQRGKLNAIGGKIEEFDGNNPSTAMRREFMEETGVEYWDWVHTVTLVGPDYEVFFFVGRGNPSACKQMEEERIITASVEALPSDCIPNLWWILPLSLDPDIQHPVIVKDVTMAGKGQTKTSSDSDSL